MTETIDTENKAPLSELTKGFRAFRTYVGFIFKDIYYKDIYFIDQENIPEDGTPLLVVSDHQNSLNDAFGFLYSMLDRKVHFITRADVFKINPLFTKLVYWIGLLPAFRMGWEGEAALSNNDATFRQSEQNLLNGHTVVMFPEAGHQNKHWLGNFSYGYTRMAFQAAETGNFEKDIQILPCCNHYSGYFLPRESMLVRFGKPVSLKPYYELYKTKPRTAQREVNALVREQISSMMLNITDLENYDEIDFLRLSVFGRDYAKAHGLDPEVLPEKLESDKALFRDLDSMSPEEKGSLYSEVAEYSKGLKEEKIEDRHLEKGVSLSSVVFNIIILAILSPLAVTALWPSVLAWGVPKAIMSKIQDKMLTGTFVLAVNILIVLPLCAIITLICTWVNYSLFLALIHVALLPLLCLFEWFYYKKALGTVKDFIFLSKKNSEKVGKLRSLREGIQAKFKQILTKKQSIDE